MWTADLFDNTHTMKPSNFRDFTQVFMIEVCEGKGTPENPSRIVQYFYTTDGQFIGRIDPADEAQ
jgi:hypothetical protein